MLVPSFMSLQHSSRKHWAKRGLAAAVSLQCSALPALAGELQFSEGFLIGGKAIDVQRYAEGNPLEPGSYRIDVMVNGEFLRTQDIDFLSSDEDRAARPCLPRELLHDLPLQPQYLAALEAAPEPCVDLPTAIDGATVSFDSSTLQLQLGIPQAAQARVPRGYVPVEQRDPGISAAFIDYTANHHRSRGSDTSYLGLNAGVNVGAWRFRHRASISDGPQGTRHNTLGSYLQRDIPGWNSQLLLGQGNTGGELFESLAFTGVRAATDERMLPDSLRGYAPTVQGIAEGNAVVTVRQNGSIIHETNVAPGPFVIDDLYPTSFGGDLEVTVTEADGRAQRFNVNFSAVPQALRAGASRFSATAGSLRDTGNRMQPLRFGEATYARGMNNRLTLLGGAQWAEGYGALVAGAAINTGIGAFGADITHSRASLRAGGTSSGNSYRLNYQRYVAATGTNFGLAAYRYTTRGFLTLNEVARLQDDDWTPTGRARQRYQVNFSQKLGERSNLYLSGGHVSYWDSARRRNDLQLGFQSVAGRANYSVSVLRYQVGQGRQDTRYAFTLSVPLGRALGAPRMSSQLSHDGLGQQGQLGLAGTMGERRAVNYNVSASTGSGSRNGNAYLGYQGPRIHLNTGYSQGEGYRSQTFGAAGSVVMHAGGINVGPPVGEGFALVKAKGAEGARVGWGDDVRIAGNGYALLPHVSPYRWNRIDLDPSGLPLETELLQTSQRVAPTAGGVVRVAFEARTERTLFVDATDALGQPLPFAARVQSDDGRPRGAVGQGGVIQLRGAEDQGVLIVDPEGSSACRLQYRMPDHPDAYGLYWSQALCQPLGATRVAVDGARPRTN